MVARASLLACAPRKARGIKEKKLKTIRVATAQLRRRKWTLIGLTVVCGYLGEDGRFATQDQIWMRILTVRRHPISLDMRGLKVVWFHAEIRELLGSLDATCGKRNM